MATVKTANSFITWDMVQGFCRDENYYYGFDSSYSTHVDGLYKYTLDNTLSISNLNPFSSFPSDTWRFSDGCVKNGIIYAAVHSVESSPELETRHLTKYSTTDLSFISTVDVTATAAGGAGCGFAANGNLLFVDYSQTFEDIKAKTVVELTTDGVYVTSHVMDDFVYGAQGITYDKDRDVYYISSHYTLNGNNEVVTVSSSWEVIIREDPDNLSSEMEGIEYYSPNLLVSEIESPPRYMDLSSAQVNNNTLNKAFTYTLPTIATTFSNAPIFLDETAFPADSIDGSANGFINRGVNLRAFTDSGMTTELSVNITTFEVGSNPKIRMHVKLPTVSTNASIFLLADKSITEERLNSATYGGNSVWTRAISSVMFPFPNFNSIPDMSGVNNDFTIVNNLPIGEDGAYNFDGKYLQQTNSTHLVGENEFYFRILCNTGTLTITGTNSPHRLQNSLGGAFAFGLTTTHFCVWNQGWAYIPFSAGNDADLDLYLTYDGTTYKLYNNGSLVNSAAHSQIVQTQSGATTGFIGSLPTNSTLDWKGSISHFEYGLGVPTANQIASEYGNRSSSGSWGTSSVFGSVISTFKALNQTHSLYNNITRALSADKIYPKMVALDGGGDTASQPEHQVVSLDEPTATWTAQQGFARNDTHWFAFNTASLKKYDLTSAEVASNTTPFIGLPVGVDHIGDGFIDDTYIYVPVVNWDGTTQTSTVQSIAKYLISDLSLDSYFDISAQTNCNASSVCESVDGTELYVTSFYNIKGSDQRNTDIYRFDKTTGAYIGILQLIDPCVGIQSMVRFDGSWFFGSYYYSGRENLIYRYDDDFNLLTTLDPILSSAEIEGLHVYGGELYFNHYIGSPRKILFDGMYISIDPAKSTPTQFLNNSLITESNTVLMKIWFQSLSNFRSIFDNETYVNDWEAWSEVDADLQYRVDSAERTTNLAGLAAKQYFILAFTWEKIGSNVTIKLGKNGSYVSTNTAGAWLTPPTTGLWLGGKNASNDQADNIYKDILVFNKVLSDAELLDSYSNFDDFYIDTSTPIPLGTTTITSITETQTTAEVTYSYDDTDETGYKYRLDGGTAVDIGTTNPFTITGLTADTSYTVEVLAYNANGDGSWSSVSTLDTLPITSTLSITDSNTPDGTYSGKVYNDDYDTFINSFDFVFSGGDCDLILPVDVDTNVHYIVTGSNPPTTGIANIGVTI